MKGTPSKGKRNKVVHGVCRRCGKHAYHLSRGICAACGFGKTSHIKRYAWMSRKTDGTRVK